MVNGHQNGRFLIPDALTVTEFEDRLRQCVLVVPTIVDISEKIEEAKEMMEYVKVEISPLTNDLLAQLEEAAEKFVTRSYSEVKLLVDEQQDIRRQVKAKFTELDLIEMYSESGVKGTKFV